MRNKKPSEKQIGIEIDFEVIKKWNSLHQKPCEIIHGDAIQILNIINIDRETLVYADPPYHPETRRRSKVYKHDYSIDDHIMLLDVLFSLDCNVIISGYFSDLYSEMLHGWNIYRYNAKTHSGIREECLWYNFDKPSILHDYRFIGDNFRERERIKRKRDRIIKNLNMIPEIERNAILAQLTDNSTLAGEV